ncbi:MAG: cache domain-containing protein [Betaproteobacteria bacterium]|nr:cache domain-containing protein [Betaproteobacteria bacterium]
MQPLPELQARTHAIHPAIPLYAVFASLWILLSDQVVEGLFTDPSQIILASTLKGWLFVGVTTLLLYALLRRGMEGTPTALPRSGWQGWPFLLLALAIIAVTGFGIAHIMAHQRDMEVARLQAVVDLRTRQITDWLRERQADAEFVQSSGLLAEQYRLWQKQGDARARDRLMARLEQLLKSHQYHAITVLDPHGRRLWGSLHAPHEPAPELLAAAAQASRERSPRRVGPYRGEADPLRLDFLAPLTALPGPAPVIVLHVDPAAWLFPVLHSWPVPSASGESVLFRRDGSDVLFLNELRHRRNTALRQRLSIRRVETLAVRILLGKARPGEVLTGQDYRGLAVMGMAHAIPGTDWYLLAKLDQSEVYREARKDAVWIALAGLLALFVTGAGMALMRQRQQLALAEGVRESQEERMNALRLLHQQTEELHQRNEELERFNRAMVGRELDMIALKRQANALSHRLGEAPLYPLAFLEGQGPDAP